MQSRLPGCLPIQLDCIVFMRSGHWMLLKSRSSSAYFVILKNHCSRSLLVTEAVQRSQVPSGRTCSLARVVWQVGHQLAGALFL